jgi:hypothetical protein
MNDEKETTHESYGLLSISRVTGQFNTLFGSNVKHHGAIALRVSRAKLIRSDLHYDRYMDTEEVVEVYLSPTQWAEAITTLNCGSGTPCTLIHVQGKTIEMPPETTSLTEQFNDEFKERLQKAHDKIKEHSKKVKEILNKPTINKTDRKELASILAIIESLFTSSAPFVHDMFREACDNVVVQAKGEIESFYTTAIVNSGIAALNAPEPKHNLLEVKP